jgi:hypothetical protein
VYISSGKTTPLNDGVENKKAMDGNKATKSETTM